MWTCLEGLELACMKTLPQSFCPDGTLVETLASEAAALTRNFDVAKSFVHVELCEWLPFWPANEPDAGRRIAVLQLWQCEFFDVCYLRFRG